MRKTVIHAALVAAVTVSMTLSGATGAAVYASMENSGDTVLENGTGEGSITESGAGENNDSVSEGDASTGTDQRRKKTQLSRNSSAADTAEEETVPEEDVSGKVEGAGFDTPEKAASAYMEGFAGKDIRKILSSCAVESYVDNYDIEKQTERLRSYSLYMTDSGVPYSGEFGRDLNVELRRASIIRNLKSQYLTLIADPEFMEGTMIGYDPEESDITEFMESIFPSDPEEIFDSITFDRMFVPQDLLTEGKYGNAMGTKNHKAMLNVYNVESGESVAAVFTAGGKHYYMMLETGKYNGKWYVLMPGGFLGSLMGIPASQAGIALVENY